MLDILVTIALGKNKNRFVYHTLSLSTMIIENLGEVELVFIEKGHTQNANDTMHSQIENAKSPNKPYHVTVKTNSLIIRPFKKRNRFSNLQIIMSYCFFMQIATAKAEAIIRKRLQHTYTHPSSQHSTWQHDILYRTGNRCQCSTLSTSSRYRNLLNLLLPKNFLMLRLAI